MYQVILVPLDGSQHAESALPVAVRLAHASGATIQLVTVDVALPIPEVGTATVALSMTNVATSTAQYVQLVADRIAQSANVAATATVLEPPAVQSPSIGRQIADHAEQTGVDLIVMTTHARAAVPRLFLGSVALEVVRWSQIPVLLIKPVAPAPGLVSGAQFRQVLVPLDGSGFSEEVLAPAMQLGQLGEAGYTLLRVFEPLQAIGTPVEPVMASMPAKAYRKSLADAESHLEHVADRLRQRELRVKTSLVVDDNPADAIARCTLSERADVIAMTTHARGALAGALLGSVATQVIRKTGVPVLLYRPRGA